MKFLAVMLIGCILFLSSFTGMVGASPVAAKMDCCKKQAGNDACRHQPVKTKPGGVKSRVARCCSLAVFADLFL